jgi:hypothetical protein
MHLRVVRLEENEGVFIQLDVYFALGWVVADEEISAFEIYL